MRREKLFFPQNLPMDGKRETDNRDSNNTVSVYQKLPD